MATVILVLAQSLESAADGIRAAVVATVLRALEEHSVKQTAGGKIDHQNWSAMDVAGNGATSECKSLPTDEEMREDGVMEGETTASARGAYLFVATGKGQRIFAQIISSVGLSNIFQSSPGGKTVPLVEVAHAVSHAEGMTIAEVLSCVQGILRRKQYGRCGTLSIVSPKNPDETTQWKIAQMLRATATDAQAVDATGLHRGTIVKYFSAQATALQDVGDGPKGTSDDLPTLLLLLGEKLDMTPSDLHETTVRTVASLLRRLRQEEPQGKRVLVLSGSGRPIPGSMRSYGELLHEDIIREIGLENVGDMPGAMTNATYALMMHNNVISEIAEAAKSLLSRKGYVTFKKVIVVLPMVIPSRCDRERFVDDMIRVATESVETPWHHSSQSVGSNPLLYASVVVEPAMVLGRSSITSPSKPSWLPQMDNDEAEKMNEASEVVGNVEERYEGVEIGEFGDNAVILRELLMKNPTVFVNPQTAPDIPMP